MKDRLIINYLTIYFWRFHQDVVYLSTALGINRNVWPREVPCPALGGLSFVLVCPWLLRAEMYSCPHLFLFWLILSAVCWLITNISGFMSDHEVISWWQRTIWSLGYLLIFSGLFVFVWGFWYSLVFENISRKLMFFFLAFNVIHWVWCSVFVCCGFLKLKIRVLSSFQNSLFLCWFIMYPNSCQYLQKWDCCLKDDTNVKGQSVTTVDFKKVVRPYRRRMTRKKTS